MFEWFLGWWSKGDVEEGCLERAELTEYPLDAVFPFLELDAFLLSSVCGKLERLVQGDTSLLRPSADAPPFSQMHLDSKNPLLPLLEVPSPTLYARLLGEATQPIVLLSTESPRDLSRLRFIKERRPTLWASTARARARAACCQTMGLTSAASHRSAAIIKELALSDSASDAATPAPRSAAISPSASAGSMLGAPPAPPLSEDPPTPRLLELAISGPLSDNSAEGISGPGWGSREDWGGGGWIRREEAQSEAVSSFVHSRAGSATSVRAVWKHLHTSHMASSAGVGPVLAPLAPVLAAAELRMPPGLHPLEAFGGRLPCLEVLSIELGWPISPQALSDSASLPRLRSLSLTYVCRTDSPPPHHAHRRPGTTRDHFAMLARLPSLSSLRLEDRGLAVSHLDLSGLDSLPHLTSLEVRGKSITWSDTVPRRAAQPAPPLRRLVLLFEELVGQNALTMPARFPRLRDASLDLRAPPLFQHHLPLALVQSLPPSLTALRIGAYPSMSVEPVVPNTTMTDLVRHQLSAAALPALRALEVRFTLERPWDAAGNGPFHMDLRALTCLTALSVDALDRVGSFAALSLPGSLRSLTLRCRAEHRSAVLDILGTTGTADLDPDPNPAAGVLPKSLRQLYLEVRDPSDFSGDASAAAASRLGGGPPAYPTGSRLRHGASCGCRGFLERLFLGCTELRAVKIEARFEDHKFDGPALWGLQRSNAGLRRLDLRYSGPRDFPSQDKARAFMEALKRAALGPRGGLLRPGGDGSGRDSAASAADRDSPRPRLGPAFGPGEEAEPSAPPRAAPGPSSAPSRWGLPIPGSRLSPGLGPWRPAPSRWELGGSLRDRPGRLIPPWEAARVGSAGRESGRGPLGQAELDDPDVQVAARALSADGAGAAAAMQCRGREYQYWSRSGSVQVDFGAEAGSSTSAITREASEMQFMGIEPELSDGAAGVQGLAAPVQEGLGHGHGSSSSGLHSDAWRGPSPSGPPLDADPTAMRARGTSNPVPMPQPANRAFATVPAAGDFHASPRMGPGPGDPSQTAGAAVPGAAAVHVPMASSGGLQLATGQRLRGLDVHVSWTLCSLAWPRGY